MRQELWQTNKSKCSLVAMWHMCHNVQLLQGHLCQYWFCSNMIALKAFRPVFRVHNRCRYSITTPDGCRTAEKWQLRIPARPQQKLLWSNRIGLDGPKGKWLLLLTREPAYALLSQSNRVWWDKWFRHLYAIHQLLQASEMHFTFV